MYQHYSYEFNFHNGVIFNLSKYELLPDFIYIPLNLHINLIQLSILSAVIINFVSINHLNLLIIVFSFKFIIIDLFFLTSLLFKVLFI